jgi:hypothetical protein
MNWPRVTVRPARPEDLPELQRRLLEQRGAYEQQDLRKTILYVAEYDGKIVGFSAARMIWQIEPLLLTPEFKKKAPHFARQKATYLLIRELDRWIADRQRNLTGIHWYFCSIVGKTMQQLAVSFGMLRVYPKSKFFGRDC